MFTDIEKKLVARDYIDNKDPTYILSYHKKSDPLVNINIGYYPFKATKRYKFTFPISHGQHYTTYFDDDVSLCEYVHLILSIHISKRK